MAVISLAEELVNKYSTEDVISWAEAELKKIKQITLSKETDKSFLLGRVSTSVGDISNVLEELRKKLKPETKNEPPVVAG